MGSSSQTGRARKLAAAGLLAAAIGGAAVYSAFQLLPPASNKTTTASKPIGLSATPEPGPTRVDYTRFDQRIGRLMQMPDMVGLAVGTVENGHVRFVKGYGETVAGSGDPVTPDTVFRWGSVSKGVAATLVAKLAEDGKLSLDTPITKMGTTLRLPDKSQKVTVADVLSHRVGLVRNAWDDRLEKGEDPRRIRAELGTLPPFCPPATCHAYQNVAFDTATEVVENVTGRSYGAVVHDRLFAPLGMTTASVDRRSLQTARSWARPYRMAKQLTTVNDIYYRIPAAGGVNGSINDLVKWMRAQMGAAPGVLSPAVLETLHRPRVPTPPHGRRNPMDRALTDATYGLGWRSFTYAGHHLVGHRGSVDGYRALILFDPADRSGIVMLWNSNWPNPARLQLEFFDRLYGLPPTDWLGIGAITAEVEQASAQVAISRAHFAGRPADEVKGRRPK